jgi:hypothetical protein
LREELEEEEVIVAEAAIAIAAEVVMEEAIAVATRGLIHTDMRTIMEVEDQ